jgi:hypothetical protein
MRRRQNVGSIMFGKWLATTIGFALVAIACSADSTSLTVEEYVVAMQAVESGFVSDAPDPAGQPEDRDQYPLGGDLVGANVLYMYYEERLDGWRAISPPSEMGELHSQLVDALEAVQREVGEYLGEQAMSANDFDFDSIGPAVRPFLRDASVACRELRSALSDAGAEVEFADSCDF